MSATIYSAAFGSGGGSSRYSDFVVVRLTNCSFITTPMELQQVSAWARGRMASGVAHRDRTTFIERFETIIGRSGSSITTKGNRGMLSRMVKSMKASSLMLPEWSIPHDLDVSMEMKKPVAVKPLAAIAKLAAAVMPLAVVTTLAAVVMPLAAVTPSKVPV